MSKTYNQFRAVSARRSFEPMLNGLNAEHRAIKLLLLYALIDDPNESPDLLRLMCKYVKYLPVRYRGFADNLYRAVHDVGPALSGRAKHIDNGFASCTNYLDAALRFKSMYCSTEKAGVLEVDQSNVLFSIYMLDFIYDPQIEAFALRHAGGVGEVCGDSFDKYYDPKSLLYKRVRSEREVFAVFAGPISYLGLVS